MEQRLLWIPNSILIDKKHNPAASMQSCIKVLDKLSKQLPVIFIEQISFEESFVFDFKPLIERDHYQVFRSRDFGSNDNRLFPVNSGDIHAYKIACTPEYFRRAFVHVYDILGHQIPMVILADDFAKETQPFCFIAEEKYQNSTDFIDRSESFVLQADDFLAQQIRFIDSRVVFYP